MKVGRIVIEKVCDIEEFKRLISKIAEEHGVDSIQGLAVEPDYEGEFQESVQHLMALKPPLTLKVGHPIGTEVEAFYDYRATPRRQD